MKWQVFTIMMHLDSCDYFLGDFFRRWCSTLPHTLCLKIFRLCKVQQDCLSLPPNWSEGNFFLAKKNSVHENSLLPNLETIYWWFGHKHYPRTRGVNKLNPNKVAGLSGKLFSLMEHFRWISASIWVVYMAANKYFSKVPTMTKN